MSKKVTCPECQRLVKCETTLDDKIKLIDHLNQEGIFCPGSRSEVN